MLEILRDPIWQTVLGIVALIFSVSSIRLQQNIKKISCKILSIAPLFDIKDDMQGKIKFLFDEKPIKNAFLIVFRIINSGKIPVTANDQKRAITVNIPAGKILTSDIIEKQPQDIEASITTQDCSIILEPTLINPGETITIKTVAESFSGNITTSARIVGANQIETILPNSDLKIRWLNNYKWAIISIIVGIIGISYLILASTTFTAPPEITIARDGSHVERGKETTIPIDNCAGTSDITTNLKETKSVVEVYIDNQKIESLSGYFDFPSIGSLSIGQEIAETYGLTYGQSLERTTTFEFTTPAATRSIYTFQPMLRIDTGEITIYQPSENKVYKYNYKILIDSTSELTSRENFACP